MILNHINYKMPIYKDCTLGEVMAVGVFNLLVLSVSLSLLTELLFHIFLIGFILALFLLVHATRFSLSRLQTIKYGKPYGYYYQLLLKKLQQKPLCQSFLKLSYIQRQGKWSVRR